MNQDRRTFIKSSGMTLTAAGAIGCGQSSFLSPNIHQASTPVSFKGPETSSIDLISHHLNRLTFGPRPGDYDRINALADNAEEAAAMFVEEQLHPERIHDSEGERAVRRLTTLQLPKRALFEYKERHLLEELVSGTLLRATFSQRQLFEVMVEFWTDHFNIDPSKGDSKWLKTWDDREVIRAYALGDSGAARGKNPITSTLQLLGIENNQTEQKEFKFPDMLKASALSPAMLWYLDGRQNRKANDTDKPNENYARELLELHTLGVEGGYTQKDVMEVARCLTGWFVHGSNKSFKNGKVVFNKYQHDDGEKIVLGQKIPAGQGAKDLDSVLDIIGLHPSTARYISTKLCKKFISDEPSESVVEGVSKRFINSKGDIRETLRALFQSDDFRQERGTKFKRPFRFVISSLRATAAKTDGGKAINDFLLKMGHSPFNYPTPDGYPEEPEPWLGSLLWRWNFAHELAENRIHQTKINLDHLVRTAASKETYASAILGRTVTAKEMQAFIASGSPLAAALSSPDFQYH